jgi:hypothetical protein
MAPRGPILTRNVPKPGGAGTFLAPRSSAAGPPGSVNDSATPGRPARASDGRHGRPGGNLGEVVDGRVQRRAGRQRAVRSPLGAVGAPFAVCFAGQASGNRPEKAARVHRGSRCDPSCMDSLANRSAPQS